MGITFIDLIRRAIGRSKSLIFVGRLHGDSIPITQELGPYSPVFIRWMIHPCPAARQDRWIQACQVAELVRDGAGCAANPTGEFLEAWLSVMHLSKRDL